MTFGYFSSRKSDLRDFKLVHIRFDQRNICFTSHQILRFQRTELLSSFVQPYYLQIKIHQIYSLKTSPFSLKIAKFAIEKSYTHV